MQRRLRTALGLLLAVLVLLGAPGAAAAEDDVAAVPAGSISGRVTVPAGVDVTRVYVEVSRTNPAGIVGSTHPLPDGTYTFGGLAPGGYYVHFYGWDVGLIYQMYPGAPGHDQASLVTVGSGSVTGIDAQMVRGATLSGRITTNSDCDLTQVDVHVDGPPGLTPDGVVQPDGRWSISGLPGAAYAVRFDGREAGLELKYWNLTGDPYARPKLTVATGEVRTGLDVHLNGPTTGCVAAKPYIFQLYNDLLGRDPDPMAISAWANNIAWGWPLIAVATAITSSDEYHGIMLRATYSDYLGRSADDPGMAFWLGRMRAGEKIQGIEAGFLASDEIYARFGGTPQGWVTGLYGTVLGRTPSPGEVQWWTATLGAGMNRGTVAGGFLYSTEHLTAVVDGYYLDLLGRHIDPSGQTTWVGLIQQGHRDEEIVASIVTSAEYLAKVPRWS